MDNPYSQLISFRSDQKANTGLESDEQRPVSLVGYSFEARVVFSYRLELIRHQAVWEEQHRPIKAKDAIVLDDEVEGEEGTNGIAKKQSRSIARRRRIRQNEQEASVVYKREPASIMNLGS